MRTSLYSTVAGGIVVDVGVTVAGDVATAGGVVSVFQGRDGQNNDDLKDEI